MTQSTLRSGRSRTMMLVLAALCAGWLAHREFGPSPRLPARAAVLAEVLSRVEGAYVEDVELDQLYGGLAGEAVRQLGDPYSRLIEKSDWENQRIGVEGDYGGVGLEVVDRDGHVTVLAPIPGTPAAEAGVLPGDRIVEVDGESVEGWGTDRTVPLLRGEPGTPVTMGVRRWGVEPVLSFDIVRERVQVPQVPFAALLDDGVGYVPLRAFADTAAAAVRAAVDSLSGEGMRALVLDLRGNRGGLLEEGLALADLFLDPGREVVEIRGRAADPDVYRTETSQPHPELPVAVLVGPVTASAAEIVAGALQDHDRALLIGSGTFGKGLVQSLFRLSGGAVLRLTTARWYTPLGRRIHVDGLEDDEEPNRVPALLGGLAKRPPNLATRPQFRSPGGRTVYGGGGITPDLWVVPDTLTEREAAAVTAVFNAMGTALLDELHDWAVRYRHDHPGLAPGFALSDDDLGDFHAALSARGEPVSDADVAAARRYLLLRMADEVAHQAWGDRGRFERQAAHDPPLQKARELLAGARSPEELFAAAGMPLAEGG